MAQSKTSKNRPPHVVAYVRPDERAEIIAAAEKDRRSVSDFVGKAAIDAARQQLKAA